MQSNKTIIITTAILILTLLSAGCTDTGGANPETTTYTPPQESPEVEETTTAEPMPEPVETWWSDKDYLSEGVIDADQNLFDENIEGVIYESDKTNGGLVYHYDVFSKTEPQLIFQHQEYPNIRLDLELSPDQYRTLNAQYGAMDKVAVKYMGSDGVLEFDNAHNAGWGIASYIYMELIE